MRIVGIEEWKPHPQGSGYEVSNLGNVRKRINVTHPERKQYCDIKPFYDKDGYKRIQLTIQGKAKKIHVHRLVYSIFIGELKDGFVCCHIDGNKLNNHPSNLLQATQKENIGHKRQHGTWQAGENHPRAKLTNDQVGRIQLELMCAMRTPTGRLKKKEVARISFSTGVDVSLIYSISRTRSTYVTA